MGIWKTQEATWDDITVPFTQSKQGSNLKPDFDYTNLGLLFPNNNTAEVVDVIVQFPHNRKLGTNIKPHIHFVQSSANQPVFKMNYRWYDNGASATPNFTTLTASTFAFEYVSGSILQIVSFPEIDGSSIVGLSSMMDIKIYRDDAVVTGDVLVKEFDIHYQLDSNGSRSELVK
jgi:hypothetical protein